MRIMALDYGSKTVGVALSDPLLMTAQPHTILRREREGAIRKTLSEIEEIVRREDVRLIVVGLPLNMDGTEGDRAALSRAFRDKVERRCGVPAVMSDERLTTVEADETMDSLGLRGRAQRKQYVDMIAAGVILREYMDNHPEELGRRRWE